MILNLLKNLNDHIGIIRGRGRRIVVCGVHRRVPLYTYDGYKHMSADPLTCAWGESPFRKTWYKCTNAVKVKELRILS